jgi:hypothetical protein
VSSPTRQVTARTEVPPAPPVRVVDVAAFELVVAPPPASELVSRQLEARAVAARSSGDERVAALLELIAVEGSTAGSGSTMTEVKRLLVACTPARNRRAMVMHIDRAYAVSEYAAAIVQLVRLLVAVEAGSPAVLDVSDEHGAVWWDAYGWAVEVLRLVEIREERDASAAMRLLVLVCLLGLLRDRSPTSPRCADPQPYHREPLTGGVALTGPPTRACGGRERSSCVEEVTRAA